jgi:hypothetical protein
MEKMIHRRPTKAPLIASAFYRFLTQAITGS